MPQRPDLPRLTHTQNGTPITGLEATTKNIKGFLLLPGPNGTRHQACVWLLSGKHNLYPGLNLPLTDPN